jgi:ribosomal protein L37AE/L43A
VSALKDSTDDVKTCPYCGETNGVEVIPDTSPKVWAWSCQACGTDWAVSVVNPQVRPWLVQLAEDLAALAVLQEITTLADQADTLTTGQLRVRLLTWWVRLDEVCRPSAASGFPAGHRPDNEVPGAQPVPTKNGTIR